MNKTIKDAHKELKGDLNNTDCPSNVSHKILWFNTMQCNYITLIRSPYLKPEIYQYVCTVEEFNNHKEIDDE